MIPTVLTACLGLAPVLSPTVAEEPTRPWTLMIYGAADNNADGPILEFLESIREGLDDDPGMTLLERLAQPRCVDRVGGRGNRADARHARRRSSPG